MTVADLRGNNLDVVRRNNLSLVLGRVHTLGAISRAQLTRESGLNRSTIAALVAELVSLGLAVETEPDQTNQVGRPSPVIVPGDRVVAITVHPELDAVTIGLVALGGRVLRSIRYPVMRVPSANEAVDVAAAVITGMRDELASMRYVAGIGPRGARTGESGWGGHPRAAPRLARRAGRRDAERGDGLSGARRQRREPGGDRRVGARRRPWRAGPGLHERRRERHRRRHHRGRRAAHRSLGLRGRDRPHAGALGRHPLPLAAPPAASRPR